MEIDGNPATKGASGLASPASGSATSMLPPGAPNGIILGKARGILAGVAELPPPPMHPSPSIPAATKPLELPAGIASPDTVSAFLPCTGCGGSLGTKLKSKKRREHPLLKVPICSGCLATYESGEFEMVEEDKHELYCRFGPSTLVFLFYCTTLAL